MHQAQCRDAALVFQITVVGANLVGQQQPLVDHRAAAHRGHVILFAVAQAERLDVGAGRLADHIQLALQRVLHDHVVPAANEHLADDRLLGAHCWAHRHVAVHRHVAPAQQHLAFELDGALQLFLASQTRRVLLRQKDHADAVFAGRRQLDALLGHLLAVELVGHLDQDARAVAHQLVGPHGAAVVEVFQNLERLGDDCVAFFALDVRHKADAARVVLVRRVVQAVLLQVLLFSRRAHRSNPFIVKSREARA